VPPGDPAISGKNANVRDMRVSFTFLSLLIGVAVARPARADAGADVTAAFGAFVADVAANKPTPGLELFLVPSLESDALPDRADVRALIPKPKVTPVRVVVAKSGTSAWIAAEIAARVPHDGKVKDEALRASGFLIKDGSGWHVRATQWSIGVPNRRDPSCGALTYEWDIDPGVPAALTAPVKTVVESLNSGRPQLFVALLSDDKQAFTFGSAPREKLTGGKAIKALFKKWQVHLSYWNEQDQPALPARAGAAPDGELMWTVLSIGSPSELCTTYGALFVLAKEPAGWRIVHQHYAERFYP
jgi:ketosteroid isomerase-like protein